MSNISDAQTNRFKLATAFEDINDIQRQLKDRKGVILNNNTQYYSYILPKQIDKSIISVETGYTPMSSFLDNNGDTIENWVNYDINLVNMDVDFLGFMKSEIVLTVGTGEGITGDSSGFAIREYPWWQEQEVVGLNQDGSINIGKSIYMKRPYYITGNPTTVTYNANALPIYSSKLLMKFYNPTRQ